MQSKQNGLDGRGCKSTVIEGLRYMLSRPSELGNPGTTLTIHKKLAWLGSSKEGFFFERGSIRDILTYVRERE